MAEVATALALSWRRSAMLHRFSAQHFLIQAFGACSGLKVCRNKIRVPVAECYKTSPLRAE